MLFKEGIKGANPAELGELFFTLKSTPWNTLHGAAESQSYMHGFYKAKESLQCYPALIAMK